MILPFLYLSILPMWAVFVHLLENGAQIFLNLSKKEKEYRRIGRNCKMIIFMDFS
jgi:hypothetical protein